MAEAQKCFDEGNVDKPGGTKMISLPVVKEKEPVTKQPDETFLIDTNLIPKSSLQDHEMGELAGLGLNIFNQDEFEQGVMNQVGQALAEEEEKRIRKILEKELKGVEEDIKQTKVDLVHIVKMVAQWSKGDTNSPEVRRRLETVHKSKDVKLKQIKKLVSRKKVLEAKLCGVDLDSSDEDDGGISSILKKEAVAVESEQERMIRQGEMTPFGTVITQSTSKQSKLPTNSELKVPDKDPEEKIKKEDLKEYLLNKLKSKKSTKRPSQTETTNEVTAEKRTRHNEDMPSTSNDNIDPGQADRRRHILPIGVTADDIKEEEEEEEGEIIEDQNDEDYIPDSDEECSLEKTKEKKTAKHIKRIPKPKSTIIRKSKDDGDIKYFDRRIRDFQKEELARQNNTDSDDEDEEFEGGLAVPGRIWSKLFNYQRIGVRWLWELHGQEAGGIVGDEMGLGKTIQTIAFLAALRQSKLRNKQFRHAGLGPCIIVCPTTVMHQWVKEFHKWWPLFRVAVLHSSGCHVGKVIDLIRGIVKDNGILITSYNTLVGCKDDLLPYNWHYVILDEGHKIRNPDAQATLVCKQFRTPHRIILSGSPIQNNLKELWSLFDFIFPGKLGTLPDFMQHFSVPIVQGGYANATQVQVETAFRCASILRDTINPFLLRRMKADVKINLGLPDKTEQVLFCRLTDEQHDVYKQYLTSRECENILAGKFQIFAGLITLRKICNHPDISTGGPRVFDVTQYDNDESLHYGYHKRSGKMIVVEALLKLWKQQGHKVLLFSQSTKMLDILESFVQKQDYNYLRMDGTTNIGGRQPLVLKFNKDPSIFVFLLTTRVGGLGVNLTGANRVIIFDPDWNPSTDTQARERAWRIGQQKSVTIYRLLTSGTIEEKIYHRQIFKQFLSNRVLKDPKQRRLFKSSDIYELFTLGSKDNEEGTETSAIFAGTGSDVKLKKNSKNIFDEIKDKKEAKETSVSVEDEEVVRMREFARKLSQQMEQNKLKKSNSASNLDDIDSETSAASKPSTSKNKITYADYKRTKLLKSADSDAKSKVKESHASLSTSQSTSSSNHHSRRKEKKKKKDAKVDGERISHLVKQRKYKRSSQEEDDETQPSSKQDDFVLQTLFQKGGIHEAMKHDKIMDCGRPDYAIVEAEAEKVAKQAVAALRKSRVNCATATSGVPTWTGQNGGIKPRFGKKKSSVVLNSGATSNSSVDKTSTSSEKHFDGTVSGYVATTCTTPMSSDELLTRMRERKMPSSASAFDSAVESLASKVDPVHTDLLTDIRNFVAFQARNDGQAMTQELLDYFGDRLPPSDSAKFKAMLKQLCHFDKSTGIGIWQLKEEFR